MLGSHNTMTYAEPRCRLAGLLAPLWRCQDKTVFQQYDAGVRFFDLRVARTREGWRFAHGLATLRPRVHDTIRAIEAREDAYYRVVLERGDGRDEEAFRNTFMDAAWMERCTELVVKKGWRVVSRNGALLRGARLVDLSYVPLKSDTPWYRQLPVRLTTPERWARAHNRIPEGGAEAEDTVYFMDFATEYAKLENGGR